MAFKTTKINGVSDSWTSAEVSVTLTTMRTGLLNHDWSDFRNQTVIDSYVKPFVQATNP